MRKSGSIEKNLVFFEFGLALNQNRWFSLCMMKTTTTLEEIKLGANKLFINEGPSHELTIEKVGNHKWNLQSTSGTSYHTGTRQGCIDRKNELIGYATFGI